MGGRSGGSQTTQTIQKADPWAGQQPYLSDVFSQAQRLYYTRTPQYYPGSTIAPPSPETLNAQNYLAGLAQGGLRQYAQTAQVAAQNALNAPDLANNPYLPAAIEAAIQPAVRGFQTAVMPTIRADFGGGENYGSSRRAIATGLASDALARNIFDTAARMAGQAYSEGLGAQTRALAIAPQTVQALQAPGMLLDAVGQQQQAYQQDLINEAIQRWNFEQQAPWAALAQYQNLVQGNFGGEGTSTTVAPMPQRNRALSALGGAASGAALGAVIPGIGAPIGALAGLILGGLF